MKWMRKYRFRVIFVCMIVIICLITVSKHIDFVKAFAAAQMKGIQSADTQILKQGYYCGEGGTPPCHHGDGYIFCEKELSTEEVMQTVGFEEISSEEYKDGPDYLEIGWCIPCLNGYLLYYYITGTG